MSDVGLNPPSLIIWLCRSAICCGNTRPRLHDQRHRSANVEPSRQSVRELPCADGARARGRLSVVGLERLGEISELGLIRDVQHDARHLSVLEPNHARAPHLSGVGRRDQRDRARPIGFGLEDAVGQQNANLARRLVQLRAAREGDEGGALVRVQCSVALGGPREPDRGEPARTEDELALQRAFVPEVRPPALAVDDPGVRVRIELTEGEAASRPSPAA